MQTETFAWPQRRDFWQYLTDFSTCTGVVTCKSNKPDGLHCIIDKQQLNTADLSCLPSFPFCIPTNLQLRKVLTYKSGLLIHRILFFGQNFVQRKPLSTTFVVLKVEQRETERGRLNLTRLGNQTQGWGQILRQSRYPPQFWGKQAPSSTIVVQSRTLKLHGLQKLRSMQDHQLQCKDQTV